MVFAGAVLAFVGLLGLFGYPLVNSLTHVAERLPTMVDQVQKGHGWLAHTLQRFHLLSWVQKNAPKLKTAAHNLGKPALDVGTNLGKAVFSTILALTTIGFLSLFMLLEAPNLRRGFLGTMRPDRRQIVEDIAHRVSRSGDLLRARHHRPVGCCSAWWSWSPCSSWGCPSPCSSGCGWRWWP